MESRLQDRGARKGDIRREALTLFAPHRRRFAWASTLGLATLGGQLILLAAFWTLLRGVSDGTPLVLWQLETGGALAAMTLTLAFLRWRQPLAQMQAEQAFVEDLQTRMLEAMLSRPPSYWAKAEHGELVQRLGTDVSGTLGYVRALLQSRWLIPLRIVAFSALLGWMAPRALGPALLVLPLFGVALALTARGIARAAAQERESRIAHSSRLAQILSGAEILSAFDARRRAADALARQLRTGYARALASTRYTNFGTQAAEFIRIAGVLSVLVLGARQYDTATTISTVPLLFLLYSPMAELARLMPQLARGRLSTGAVLEFLRESGEREHPPATFATLETRDLHFAYDDAHIVLGRVNLLLRAGEWLAITGESGQGKSTLLKLLLGAEAPLAGEILCNGNPGTLRGLCALVTQEPIFPARTVRENLLVARPSATDADLWRALSRAALEERVRREGTGLDFDIGEGGRGLSGGERERLSLARALLSQAPVLALDEPGVFLDAGLRERILQTLKDERGRRTLIVVTHESDLIALADRCVVIAGACLAERPRAPRVTLVQ